MWAAEGGPEGGPVEREATGPAHTANKTGHHDDDEHDLRHTPAQES